MAPKFWCRMVLKMVDWGLKHLASADNVDDTDEPDEPERRQTEFKKYKEESIDPNTLNKISVRMADAKEIEKTFSLERDTLGTYVWQLDASEEVDKPVFLGKEVFTNLTRICLTMF